MDFAYELCHRCANAALLPRGIAESHLITSFSRGESVGAGVCGACGETTKLFGVQATARAVRDGPPGLEEVQAHLERLARDLADLRAGQQTLISLLASSRVVAP